MVDCEKCIHFRVCLSCGELVGRLTSCHLYQEQAVHGHWIEKQYLLGTTRYCSVCGQNYGMPHGVFNYCPNCGAIMDLPRITDQTMKALETMDRKARGGE